MNLTELQKHLAPRRPDAHKGQFGHVLVIGGNNATAGAPRLAAEAAARAGAGLGSIATQPAHATLIGATCPELMCYGVTHAQDLKPLLERATVVVIGPGLGQTLWSHKLLTTLLTHTNPLPCVLDADALNLLAKDPHIAHFVKPPYTNRPYIFTPHSGEAARLLGTDTETIQHDRETAVRNLQNKFGGVCVLKGAGTLVLGNDGIIHTCTEGNPGMATGGMGDVLSGIIGGLLAQHIDPSNAACLGVALHARAGDLAASKHGQRGLLASDLFPYLQQLVNPNQ